MGTYGNTAVLYFLTCLILYKTTWWQYIIFFYLFLKSLHIMLKGFKRHNAWNKRGRELDCEITVSELQGSASAFSLILGR